MSWTTRNRDTQPQWASRKERPAGSPGSSETDRQNAGPLIIDRTNGGMKSVLVLDDDAEISEVLAAILESHGYEVVKASRGVDAVQAVMEREFDVILCDMVMPGLPGDMFYMAVGRVKPHLCERFIFITGHSDNPSVSAFLDRVKKRALYKPIGMDELLETLYQFLLPQHGAAA